MDTIDMEFDTTNWHRQSIPKQRFKYTRKTSKPDIVHPFYCYITAKRDYIQPSHTFENDMILLEPKHLQSIIEENEEMLRQEVPTMQEEYNRRKQTKLGHLKTKVDKRVHRTYAPAYIRIACNEDEGYKKIKTTEEAQNTKSTEEAQNTKPTEEAQENTTSCKRAQKESVTEEQVQTDTGSNINVTNNMAIIVDPKELKRPITIGGIDNDSTITATHHGFTQWTADDGRYIWIKMYFAEGAATTIISPTAVAKDHQDKILGYMQWSPTDTSEMGTIKFIMRSGEKPLKYTIYNTRNLWYHMLRYAVDMDRDQLNQSSLPKDKSGNNKKTKTNKKSKMEKQRRSTNRIQATINAMEKKQNEDILLHHNHAKKHHQVTPQDKTSIDNIHKQRKSLKNNYLWELYHQRLGHPSDETMENLHKYYDDAPKVSKPNYAWKCDACHQAKFQKRRIKRDKSVEPLQSPKPTTKIKHPTPGHGLHMDFGFVRGSKWKDKDEKGRLITSKDGCRAYLLVVDKASRYKWIFTTKTKDPPLKQVETLLKMLKSKRDYKYVMTDQGGELGRSSDFAKIVQKAGYVLKVTGADDSKMNGIVERPHQDLANMMRTMLYSANLGPEYWTYAIIYATYLLNRRPHSALQSTPYETLLNKKPRSKHLRIFGAKAAIYNPSLKKAKLDLKQSPGIFLGYSGNGNLAIIEDTNSGKTKLSSFVVFDEAHYTSDPKNRPPMGKALIEAGYVDHAPEIKENTQEYHTLQVKPLTTEATIPTKGTSGSAGYDLYSTKDISIEPGTATLIPTDIAIKVPKGTYARIAPRSSLALKGLDTMAGVIDSDYTGNVKVLLENRSKATQHIQKGQRIAQMIIENIRETDIEIVETLQPTKRGTKGFGSTDIKASTEILAKTKGRSIPQIIQKYISNKQHAPTAVAATATKEHEPEHVKLSLSPYDNELEVTIPIQRRVTPTNRTRGLVLVQDKSDRVKIATVKNGTPSAKISKWRSTLRNSHLLKIGNETVTNTEEAHKIFASHDPKQEIKITVGTLEKIPIHPQTGLPTLYADQLQILGEHIEELKTNSYYDPENTGHDDYVQKYGIDEDDEPDIAAPTIATLKPILPKNKQKKNKLTRRKLQHLPPEEWEIWRQSEFKQMDQYQKQNMYGEPCPLPKGANCLKTLWTYLVKDDGTKKARQVVDGSPGRKGTVTIGHTYASSLDQNGSRIFWATAAMKNLKVYGADVSNAFAEAPPPKAPLYVTIDNQFREWYKERTGKDIPRDYVLPIKRAIQGHPESPRLWAILINNILTKELRMKPTTHEPNLYQGKIGKQTIYFLRQVDDFAIACNSENIAKDIIAKINEHMSVQIKYLGLLTRFNGVDVDQTKEYIKIHNKTYIQKILRGHAWLEPQYKQQKPTPMKADNAYITSLETAVPPATKEDQIKLQHEMQMNYRQGIGELLYAMITCRPDISYPVIKLSQYSNNPAKEHYQAIKEIYQYLAQTEDDGIHYWRKDDNNELPHMPIPTIKSELRQENTDTPDDEPSQAKAYVDSDWAADTNHRKSISGFVISLAGGTVYYKTKFQETVATSTAEAEFTAAFEAAKAICYVRTILNELDICQSEATILHIDNNAALLMADASKPTKNSRHMDIKQFKLQEWVEKDIIEMKRIHTHDNRSDTLTKSLGQTLYYRHNDKLLGKYIPHYRQGPEQRHSIG
ncbi:hypothetical protein CTEN210_01707 [Chaetoceros tenuissimus]|uniref:dUTP diphosphatase n=1 Tax=Chaetoceros tenuissimus TaxID=426638 RepID=A0AAD3CG59_9STRA|nr:hypothetical protein CTEN210_01707 [Chaetoceros tenuissimus]